MLIELFPLAFDFMSISLVLCATLFFFEHFVSSWQISSRASMRWAVWTDWEEFSCVVDIRQCSFVLAPCPSSTNRFTTLPIISFTMKPLSPFVFSLEGFSTRGCCCTRDVDAWQMWLNWLRCSRQKCSLQCEQRKGRKSSNPQPRKSQHREVLSIL